MDSLSEIPRTFWPQLKELFLKNWPRGVEGYCLLDNQISYPALASAFNFKVYCPGGIAENGIIAIMNNEYYQLFVCPIGEITIDLENALVNTNIIDWNRTIMVPSANCQVLACLNKVCEQLRLKLKYSEGNVFKHLLHKGSNPLQISHFPENTYVGPLKPEYVDLIDRTWTFHKPGHSRKIFEKFMDNDLAFVLYSSENNEPVAWIFLDEAGSFTHLFCLESHRRKGYAEFITKIATNTLLKKGRNVLAYTLEKNVRPQSLFNKLGFQLIENVSWIHLSR